MTLYLGLGHIGPIPLSPCTRVIIPWFSSNCNARRNVTRLTPSMSLRSRSGASRSPGASLNTIQQAFRDLNIEWQPAQGTIGGLNGKIHGADGSWGNCVEAIVEAGSLQA